MVMFWGAFDAQKKVAGLHSIKRQGFQICYLNLENHSLIFIPHPRQKDLLWIKIKKNFYRPACWGTIFELK